MQPRRAVTKAWRSLKALAILLSFTAAQISGCAPKGESSRPVPPPTSPNPIVAEQEAEAVDPESTGLELPPKAVDALMEDITESERTASDEELVFEEERRAQISEHDLGEETVEPSAPARPRAPIDVQDLDASSPHEEPAPAPLKPSKPAPVPAKPGSQRKAAPAPAPVRPVEEKKPAPAPAKPIQEKKAAPAPAKPVEEKAGKEKKPSAVPVATTQKRVKISPDMPGLGDKNAAISADKPKAKADAEQTAPKDERRVEEKPEKAAGPKYVGTYAVINTETCERLSLAREDFAKEMRSLKAYEGVLPETLPVDYYRNIEAYAKRRGLKMNAAQLKKNHFICMLLPSAIRFNASVFRQRLEVLRLDARAKNGTLRSDDKQWLETIKVRYQLPASATNEQLLERVDVVPIPLLLAQAAQESSWGTSRFTRDANNIFGMHAAQGQPSIPALGNPNVRVRKFPSIPHAVSAYIEYLNTSRAGFAANFRKARAKLRSQGRKLDSGILAEALVGYSERGRVYVSEIKAIMFKANDLTLYDLRDEDLTAVQQTAN